MVGFITFHKTGGEPQTFSLTPGTSVRAVDSSITLYKPGEQPQTFSLTPNNGLAKVKVLDSSPSYWVSSNSLKNVRRMAALVGAAVAAYMSPVATGLGALTQLSFSEEKPDRFAGSVSETLYRRILKVATATSLLTTVALATVSPTERGIIHILSFVKGFFGAAILEVMVYKPQFLLIPDPQLPIRTVATPPAKEAAKEEPPSKKPVG